MVHRRHWLGRVLGDGSQLEFYAELGDYLIRLGLSWLFLTFLSFLAFSSIVTSLSTFFLSDDLRLLLAAPVDDAPAVPRAVRPDAGPGLVDGGGVHHAGAGRRRPRAFGAAVLLPHRDSGRRAVRVIPVALGSMITLGLVNVFPARRAREVLMLMGLVFATSIVLLLQVHSAGAAAAGRVDAGGDGVLRHAPIPDHSAPALVLGGRDASSPACRAGGTRCTRSRSGRRRWRPSSRPRACSSAGTSRDSASRRRRARSRVTRWGWIDWTLDRLPHDAGPAAAAGEGPEGVPARRQPVVAAAPAARAGARLPVQLPRAGPRAHPVHEPRPEELLRVPQPGDGRLRHGHRRRPVRVPAGVVRGRRRSGSSARRPSSCATSSGRSSGRAWCRSCC